MARICLPVLVSLGVGLGLFGWLFFDTPSRPLPSAHTASSLASGSASSRAGTSRTDTLVPPMPSPPSRRRGMVSDPRPAELTRDFEHEWRAVFHPHGHRVCASGCAVSNHPTAALTRERFVELLARFAVDPPCEESLALETLLYFGPQARDWLTQSAVPLDPWRERLLRRELSRHSVRVELRLLDDQGKERASLPSTLVPLDRRHVFPMHSSDLGFVVVSGTVKRVGLHHLWTRL